MQKIIILGGGISAEREISLLTSQTIKSAIESEEISVEIIDPAGFADWEAMISFLKTAKPDMIFMGLHGAAGEDGTMQRLLESHDLPFTGSGSDACRLAMDKKASLDFAHQLNIPVAAHKYLNKYGSYSQEEIITTLGLPIVVKPNSSGSSVGIHIVKQSTDLLSAMNDAWRHDDWLLCEKFIPGRELTVTILDKRALPVVEIKPYQGWYDFANKYTHGNTEYICPAELTELEKNTVQKYALNIFNAMGCKVYSRIDFRYDGEKFFFLEVNTLPGMTSLSLTPMAAKAVGYELRDLLLKLIELSKNK